MKLTNTGTAAMAIRWAENASRALNIHVNIGIAKRASDAWLFCWESASVLGLLGTRFAIGIRPDADLAVVLVTTPDDDGTEIRTGDSCPVAEGEEMAERVLKEHVAALRSTEKMKRLIP